MKLSPSLALIALPLFAIVAAPAQPPGKPAGVAPEGKLEEGFVSLFDGQSLKGWHVSAQSGHSRTSKNTSGGRWVVENGAIIGSQDVPGNGGLVMTDEEFTDFEVAIEMNNDFGPDSGLFLRSTEDGKAWQAMIDYHSGGNLMGIYGEGLGGKPHVRNYSFTGNTWINGVKIMEWQETEIRHPEKGRIALQVHGGGDHTREFVRYRNIRVKRLK